MAQVDIHVFGSKSGYSTVAQSAGIRSDEKRELEQFQFGEVATQDAIARLETHAAMTVRMLRSGRVAVSRMLPAGTDDAGRPTIEIVTLVVEARTYETGLGALTLLASDVSIWRDARARAASGIDWPLGSDPARDPRDTGLLLLLDAWMHALRSSSVAILPESAAPALLRFVATLDPADRVRCRWGLGINSLSAPVDICTTLPSASTHGARCVVRPAAVGAWHLSETEFARFRASSGGAQWIPTSQMRSSSLVEQDSIGFEAESPRVPVRRATIAAGVGRTMSMRQKRVMVGSMIAAGCSTILLVVGAASYFRSTRPKIIQPSEVNVGQVDARSVASSTSIAPPVVEPLTAEPVVTTASRDPTPSTPPPAPPSEAAPPPAEPTNESSSSTSSGGLPSQPPAPLPPVTSQPASASRKVQAYFDGDEDGFGSDKDPRTVEDGGRLPERHALKGGDCNDKNQQIYPGAKETCTDVGEDNDCNGDAEEFRECVCRDLDKDANGTKDCEEPTALQDLLSLAQTECDQLKGQLEGDLRKCQGGQSGAPSPVEVRQMLTHALDQVEGLLQTLYRSWKLGKFGGSAPHNRRVLTGREDERVSCEWLEILTTISTIRELFGSINAFVPPDKGGQSLKVQLQLRIDIWSQEYSRTDLRTWAVELFTAKKADFESDLQKAQIKCSKHDGGKP